MLGTVETKNTGKLYKETKFQANYIAEYYYYYAGLVDKIEGSTLPIDKEDMQELFHNEESHDHKDFLNRKLEKSKMNLKS